MKALCGLNKGPSAVLCVTSGYSFETNEPPSIRLSTKVGSYRSSPCRMRATDCTQLNLDKRTARGRQFYGRLHSLLFTCCLSDRSSMAGCIVEGRPGGLVAFWSSCKLSVHGRVAKGQRTRRVERRIDNRSDSREIAPANRVPSVN